MFEININTLALDAEVPSQEALDNGANAVVAAQVVGGSSLPVADPNNPGQPLVFPSIAVNFALSKENAIAFADLLRKKAEELPDTPAPTSGKIITAQTLSEAERVAQVHNGLTR